MNQRTHLEEIGISVSDLQRNVAEGFVRAQAHPSGKLYIYNYSKEAQFQRAWNPVTITARGLILDEDGYLVARPLPKFFNLGEPDAPELPQVAPKVTEKMDGSFAAAYQGPDGEVEIATRGSFTSEQAAAATRWLRENHPDWTPEEGVTYIFEWIAPENRIVVDYGDRRELVLLTRIEMRTGRDLDGAGSWPGAVVPTYDGITDTDEIYELHQKSEPNREGYVLRFDVTDHQPAIRLKVKFAEYVALHRTITGTNERTIFEQVVGRALNGYAPALITRAASAGYERIREEVEMGTPIEHFLSGLPDEMYDWATNIVEDLNRRFQEEADRHRRVVEEARRAGIADRAEVARKFVAAKKDGYNPGILFSMWDGEETKWQVEIWRALRPEGSHHLNPIATRTDEVA